MIWMKQLLPTLKNSDLKLLNLKANFCLCNRLLNLSNSLKKVILIKTVRSVVLSCTRCLKKCTTALTKRLSTIYLPSMETIKIKKLIFSVSYN